MIRTLPLQIAERVSQKILLGDIQQGSRLTEQQLVREFDVSHGPAREAVRLLAAEGLVEIQPHRGAVVIALTDHDIRDIFDIRMMLWGLAVRRACELSDPVLVRKVEETVATLESDEIFNGSAVDCLGVGLRTMVLLARSTGNDRLCGMLRQLALPTLRYAQLKYTTQEQRQDSVSDWRLLADAMKRQDAEAAEVIARGMIRKSADAALAHSAAARAAE